MSRLGTFLTQEGLLSVADRQLIRRESVSHNGSFARSVLAIGLLDEEELSSLLAAKTSFRRAAKDIFHEMDRDVAKVVPGHILAWLEVLPLAIKSGVLHLAMVDPTDMDAANQVRFFTGLRVRPVIATRSEILRGLKEIGAQLPLEENQFESFLRHHAGLREPGVAEPSIGNLQTNRSDASIGGMMGSRKSPSDADLGIAFVQDNGPEAAGMKATAKPHVGGERPNVQSKPIEPLQPENIGAKAEGQATTKSRTRSGHAELTVAVQAGMSILNRFAMKLQLATTVDEALQKFVESAVKAGIGNGLLVRFVGDAAEFGAHWRDGGIDSTSGLTVPAEVDAKILAKGCDVSFVESRWLDAIAVFGDDTEAVLGFWRGATATPDSVFVEQTEDGHLMCLASFSGQYDHDGLRQIFADALRSLSARL